MDSILVVLLFGLFWSYVIFLIPAMVATILKGAWIHLAIGFITFGLLWYVGALGPARDGSWWARRFDREQAEVGYRAERRARRQRIALRASVALGVVFLIGFLATYPTLLTGTDRTSLQYSVGGPISFVDKCDRRRDGDWTCYRYDDAVSGDIPFRTTVDRLGCWTATNDAKSYSSIDRELSGCVTVFSHLRLADRILGW